MVYCMGRVDDTMDHHKEKSSVSPERRRGFLMSVGSFLNTELIFAYAAKGAKPIYIRIHHKYMIS